MRKRFAWALAMVLVSGLALLAASQSAQSAPSAMPVSQYTCGYWDPPGCGPGLPGCVWVPNPGPHCSTPVPATPRPPGPPPPPPPRPEGAQEVMDRTGALVEAPATPAEVAGRPREIARATLGLE